jgi:hypothetical protein
LGTSCGKLEIYERNEEQKIWERKRAKSGDKKEKWRTKNEVEADEKNKKPRKDWKRQSGAVGETKRKKRRKWKDGKECSTWKKRESGLQKN